MGKKKKFIDKKNAVSFHLVHRSQRDPLQADEKAPQHVLLPAASQQEKEVFKKQQQEQYGIYFEDDYNYMQHLKDVDELCDVEPTDVFRVENPSKKSSETKVSAIKLPSTVFASTSETDVGLLNKAAPQSGPKLDWDPDIVAGLDDDFDFDNPDNLLNDDFIEKANKDADSVGAEGGHLSKTTDVDDDDDSDGFASDEADDMDTMSDAGSFGEQSFMQEETKSRFTTYSMTSSVIRRNEGLTLLDDRFEKLFEQYDDDEIGPLDQDDIEGHVQQGSKVLSSVLEEFEEQQQQQKMKDAVQKAVDVDVTSSSGEESDDKMEMVVDEPTEKWDCESILSTYSNIYNHPKTITEPKKIKPIKLTKRAAIPEESLEETGLTRRQMEADMHYLSKGDTANTYRPKDESADEKRLRKTAVKAERKARREEKKGNKMAFKTENMRQHKEMINVHQNMKGVQIV